MDDPDLKKPMLSLNGEIGWLGPGLGLSKASFISHTTHRGKGLRTLTEVDATAKVNLGFSGRLQINDQSSHGMASNLLEMGLKGKKPFLVMYCEKARMILNEGVPVEE